MALVAAFTLPKIITTIPSLSLLIRCGPFSANRGPLHRGRILSTESIHVIQSLKRLRPSPLSPLPKSITRLIKSDLVAAVKELLRQRLPLLALRLFSHLRSDPTYLSPDLSLYADLILALNKEELRDEIDALVVELKMECEGRGIECGEGSGMTRLIRAVIGAGRLDGLVRVWGIMKRSGWGEVERGRRKGREVDAYVGKVLSRGLRSLGEVEVAEEIEMVLERF
ncbi:hypothetical protein Droror1_Dr00009922 [Drosera rotundifolia]